MALKTYTLTALACLLAVVGAAPQPDNYKQCGDKWYNTDDYSCRLQKSNKSTLCPIIDGAATWDCAGACFTGFRYTCVNDELEEKPKRQGRFTLTAVNPEQDFSGQPIQAAGLNFWVGGHASTYCPTNVGSICKSFPNDTTLLGPGGLGTVVPGGQRLYWQKDGALAFTQAHSSLMTNVSISGGGVAYEGGGFFGPNGEDLITCPVSSPGTNTTSWKLFAKLSGVNFASNCVGLYALVKDSNLTSAAWQYN